MDKEREERICPIVTLQLIPWEAKLLKLRIQNVGIGAALEVDGEIRSVFINGDSKTVPWKYSLLAPEKYEEFPIPLPEDTPYEKYFDMHAIKSAVLEINGRFKYKSISGLPYEHADTISLREVTDTWARSRMLATQDHPDRLIPRISQTLEDIAKALEKQMDKIPSKKQTPEEMLAALKSILPDTDEKNKKA